jgi:hypothetical protein
MIVIVVVIRTVSTVVRAVIPCINFCDNNCSGDNDIISRNNDNNQNKGYCRGHIFIGIQRKNMRWINKI